MTEERVAEAARRALRAALAEVAPEVELEYLDPGASFHGQLALDSMDFLRLMAALERSSGIRIPGVESHRLATPASCCAYLREQMAEQGRSGDGLDG